MGEDKVMIVVSENPVPYEIDKSIICTKCERGKICNIPVGSNARVSRRRRLPRRKFIGKTFLEFKCHVCGSPCIITFENKIKLNRNKSTEINTR